MPEWLILFAALWIILGFTRRGRGGRWDGRRWDRRRRRWIDDGTYSEDPPPDRGIPGRRDRSREDGSREELASPRRRRATPAPRPETEEERLQREFVEGKLSVEQYEDALDRMLRRGRTRRHPGPGGRDTAPPTRP